MDSAKLSGIRVGYLLRAQRALLGSDFRFFREHHGNFITHRINALASLALQAGIVGRKFHRRFAERTNQNIKQFLGNRHVLFPQQRFGLWSLSLYQNGRRAGKRRCEAEFATALVEFLAFL
jgi:hypothetical protein